MCSQVTISQAASSALAALVPLFDTLMLAEFLGRLSNSQKDEIEGQVAALVRASKDSLQGLQKYVNSPGAATQAAASKDAVAHRQGVVGSLFLPCNCKPTCHVGSGQPAVTAGAHFSHPKPCLCRL